MPGSRPSSPAELPRRLHRFGARRTPIVSSPSISALLDPLGARAGGGLGPCGGATRRGDGHDAHAGQDTSALKGTRPSRVGGSTRLAPPQERRSSLRAGRRKAGQLRPVPCEPVASSRRGGGAATEPARRRTHRYLGELATEPRRPQHQPFSDRLRGRGGDPLSFHFRETAMTHWRPREPPCDVARCRLCRWPRKETAPTCNVHPRQPHLPHRAGQEACASRCDATKVDYNGVPCLPGARCGGETQRGPDGVSYRPRDPGPQEVPPRGRAMRCNGYVIPCRSHT